MTDERPTHLDLIMKTAEKRYRQSEQGRRTIAIAAKRYRESKKGEVAQARYRKSEKAKTPRRRYQKHWRSRNPEKIRAHRILNQAIKNGTVTRLNTHAHHPDYSKPLEVEWLCPKDHAKAHAP